MVEKVDYKRAAKTTFLFSGVKVITIIVGLVRNKIAAILVGPIGVGINSVFQTYLHFVQTGAGLGLSQSAVRDVSEAFEKDDIIRFSRIISLTNKLVLFTGLLGVFVTIVSSPFFSQLGFGDRSYTLSFVLLSLCAGMQIYAENRLAILKGMRRIRSLASSTVIGSFAGLIISAPLYYFFREKGIVPVLIITSFVSLIVTNYYVNRIEYSRVKLRFKEIKSEGAPMLKMGVALMMINFLSGIASTIVISFLRGHGGLEVVAYYGVGQSIVASYFGIVLTAMTTDYYPRICGVYNDNERLQDEVNAQSKLGLVLTFPLALIFVTFASFFIPLLYSNKFLAVSQYTDWALIGSLISVPSNCIAMILLAKQDAKVFTSVSLAVNVINVFVNIAGYEIMGLTGLGVASTVNILLQWVIYGYVVFRRYGVRYSDSLNYMLLTVTAIVLVSILAKRIDSVYLKYVIQLALIVFSFIYVLCWGKRVGINLIGIIKNKFIKQ